MSNKPVPMADLQVDRKTERLNTKAAGIITLAVMPLLLFMRTPRFSSEASHVAVD